LGSGELTAALGVRDRGRRQLGELRETVLQVFGKRLARRSRRGNEAPDATVDDDRRACRSGPAVFARLMSKGAREIAVVLEPYREAGAQGFRGHRRSVERPAGAGRKRGRMWATDREHGQRLAIVPVARDQGGRELDELRHLLRYGVEDSSR